MYMNVMKYMTLIGLITLPSMVMAASFDCDKPNKPDEKVICKDRRLNDLDVEMTVKYDWMLHMRAMGGQDHMRKEQATWLKGRMACKGNKTCITKAYRERIKALDADYESLDRPQ